VFLSGVLLLKIGKRDKVRSTLEGRERVRDERGR
jgi:hypothetical protein